MNVWAARYLSDDWCRVSVLAHDMDSRRVTIRYLDFGNKEQVIIHH